MTNKRYKLTDEQWDRVSGLIKHSKMGRPPKDDRVMLNAMLWMVRSGAGWEDLPEGYGPWKTVYSRFCKWRDDGTFVRIFTVLNEDADMEHHTANIIYDVSATTAKYLYAVCFIADMLQNYTICC